jgi:hypothetical protein
MCFYLGLLYLTGPFALGCFFRDPSDPSMYLWLLFTYSRDEKKSEMMRRILRKAKTKTPSLNAAEKYQNPKIPE